MRDEDGNLSDKKLTELASHEQIKMFEIKLSQGARPGKGGIIPGAKVTPEISAIRGIKVGQDSISPNRHPDSNSVDDLIAMINRIRDVSSRPVGFIAWSFRITANLSHSTSFILILRVKLCKARALQASNQSPFEPVLVAV